MKGSHETSVLETSFLCPTPLSQDYPLFRYAVNQIKDLTRLKTHQVRKTIEQLKELPSVRKTRAERCRCPFLWAAARDEFFLHPLWAHISSHAFLSSSLCGHKLHSDLVQGMHLVSADLIIFFKYQVERVFAPLRRFGDDKLGLCLYWVLPE